MRCRAIWGSLVTLLILGLGAAQAAQAQATWTASAGVPIPVGTFDDYFEHGGHGGDRGGRSAPGRESDVTFGADWDHYNSHAYFGTPNLNQYRLRVGILKSAVDR